LTSTDKFQTFDSDSAGDQNADSGPTQVGAADGAPSDLSPAAAGPSESTGPAAADEAPADLDAATADLQAPVLRATPDDEPAPDSVPESGPAASGRRPRRLRKPILIAVAAIVAMLAAAGGTLAAMAKTVTISVDGATQQVTTLSGTVGGALSAAGVDVGQHDTLAPAQDAGISDGSNIVIQRGRLFTVTIDGRQRSVWTTATTVEAALAQLGQRASEFDLSADRSRSIPLSGLSVTADTLHTVTLASVPAPSAPATNKAADRAAGKTAGTVQTLSAVADGPEQLTTAAKTVSDLLEQQGITLGKADRVSPALDTPLSDGLAVTVTTLPTVAIRDGAGRPVTVISGAKDVGHLLVSQKISPGTNDVVSPGFTTPLFDGMAIAVTRVKYVTTSKVGTVPQPADRKVEDDSMTKGTTSVAQSGHPGKVKLTYRTKVVNGKSVGKAQEISRTTITEAVPTIIHVGTYVAPPPDPEPQPEPEPVAASSSSDSGSSGSSAPAPSTSGGPGIAVWEQIAQCESTNNWSINTGNGYYGGLQFDIPTWLGNGGGQYAPRADLATKAQQIDIANRVYASRGLSPWQCAYILGLI
jgi:uncharacterized protein YabE (DUF348 family)